MPRQRKVAGACRGDRSALGKGAVMDRPYKRRRSAMGERIRATASCRIVPTRQELADRHAILIALAAWCDSVAGADSPVSEVERHEGQCDVQRALAGLRLTERMDLYQAGLIAPHWFN